MKVGVSLQSKRGAPEVLISNHAARYQRMQLFDERHAAVVVKHVELANTNALMMLHPLEHVARLVFDNQAHCDVGSSRGTVESREKPKQRSCAEQSQ